MGLEDLGSCPCRELINIDSCLNTGLAREEADVFSLPSRSRYVCAEYVTTRRAANIDYEDPYGRRMTP